SQPDQAARIEDRASRVPVELLESMSRRPPEEVRQTMLFKVRQLECAAQRDLMTEIVELMMERANLHPLSSQLDRHMCVRVVGVNVGDDTDRPRLRHPGQFVDDGCEFTHMCQDPGAEDGIEGARTEWQGTGVPLYQSADGARPGLEQVTALDS